MKYTVGKPKIKSAFAITILLCMIGVWLIVESVWPNLRIVGCIIIVLSFAIVLPGLSYPELMWKVDEHNIQYTYYHNVITQMVYFYRQIFRTHHLQYQISIHLDQIDYIEVNYARVPRAPYGAIGYDVWFNVHTYDGSIISFIALTLYGTKDLVRAVDFMKTQDIHFKDEYHILDALRTEEPISYYLESIDKEKRKC